MGVQVVREQLNIDEKAEVPSLSSEAAQAVINQISQSDPAILVKLVTWNGQWLNEQASQHPSAV